MSNMYIYKLPVIEKSFVLKADFSTPEGKKNGKLINEDKEREKLIDEVTKESYQRGWNDALKKNQEDVGLLCQSMKKAIEDLKQEMDGIWSKSEQEIIKLTFAIAKKMVHEEISQNSSKIIERIVSDALHKVKKNRILRIYVNPGDVEKLKEMKLNALSDMNGGCEIISDSDISRGGCKIDTDYGSVDARVETRWSEIISAFEEHNPEAENREC
jgi:flagellar assembly protein FliH